jgi:hypothetical protein
MSPGGNMTVFTKKNILIFSPIFFLIIYFLWFSQYDYTTQNAGSGTYDLRTHKITGASEMCLDNNSWIRVNIQGDKISIPAGTMMTIGSRAKPVCLKWIP